MAKRFEADMWARELGGIPRPEFPDNYWLDVNR